MVAELPKWNIFNACFKNRWLRFLAYLIYRNVYRKYILVVFVSIMSTRTVSPTTLYCAWKAYITLASSMTWAAMCYQKSKEYHSSTFATDLRWKSIQMGVLPDNEYVRRASDRTACVLWRHLTAWLNGTCLQLCLLHIWCMNHLHGQKSMTDYVFIYQSDDFTQFWCILHSEYSLSSNGMIWLMHSCGISGIRSFRGRLVHWWFFNGYFGLVSPWTQPYNNRPAVKRWF